MKKIGLVAVFFNVNCHAAALEVLHWWTAPGEVTSQHVLQTYLQDKHISWKNFAVNGGGGNIAMRVLQMRALAGDPPDVAQIKGPDIGEWAKLGVIKNIDSVFNTNQWKKTLPLVVRKTVSFDDRYMAVPINIHRVNWLWLNKKIFKQLKLSAPTTWDSFFIVADKIKAAGYLPLAHGGTAWQDTLLFDSMALSLLGAEKYKQAFVIRDDRVLNSTEMVNVFKKYKRLHQYVDKKMVGVNWADASKLISTDQAAMQFMGDWVKGSWKASGKVAMVDYECVEVPETKGLFSYNIDSFVLFNKNNNDQNLANVQHEFVRTLLSKPFQKAFNLTKGSIPVRNDVDMSSFDACAKKSYRDFKRDQLVPALTQNMASTSHMQNIIMRIISGYFNDPNADAGEAVKHLSTAIRALKG